MRAAHRTKLRGGGPNHQWHPVRIETDFQQAAHQR